MSKITRRKFLKTATATGATFALASTLSTRASSKVLGANDDIRVAIVGLRKKGKEHLEAFGNMPNVRIVGLCDVDTQFLDFETKKFADRKQKVESYIDYRKLIDNKDIDAIIVAAPDHWHALMTIWACQAGKDVYIEKPLSHNIWEGRKMVQAARKYNRIVQVGSQDRSDQGLQPAFEYINQGHIGKIKLVRSISYGHRQGIGKVDGPQPIPPTVDYNLFQGPAPLTPLMRKNLHYDWHWFWDTGTGECGNLAAHVVDESRWAIGQNKIAPQVMTIGGRFGFDDDGQTPNTHIALFDYKPVPIIYEMRNLPRNKKLLARDRYKTVSFGEVIFCEEGYFAGGRGGGWIYDHKHKKVKQFPGDGGQTHQANFIQAMRSRKVSDLNADILEGHISAALCHMANISFRIGRHQPAQKITDRLSNNPEMSDSFERMMTHLKLNELDFQKEPMTLGPLLTFDDKNETFIGPNSDSANRFLRRTYRKPFVVPENV